MILAAGAGMASVTAITAAEVMPTPDALAAGHHSTAPESAVPAGTGHRGHRSATRRLRRHRSSAPATAHIESVSAPVLVSQAEMQQLAGGSPPPEAVATGAAAPAGGAAPTGSAAPAGAAAPAGSGTSASPASSSSAAPATRPADSGGSPSGSDLGMFTVTCYAIHGRTATGDEAGPQSVAVDPSVIPLGSHIWIEGVGYRTADDTGGAIRGHHIDIWESTTSACAQFGRQYLDVRMAS